MSTLPPISAVNSSSNSVRASWPNWLREPILHFMIIGGLLFTADHFVAGQTDDPRTIVLTEEVDNEFDQLFLQSRDREPEEKEKDALRRVWIDNEVLYREGLALQLDKGDTAIRERVIFKALSMIDASVKLPPYDDKLLRDWFENHRAKYDDPARYDFQEAVMSGDNSEVAVRSFVETLNAGAPGDIQAGLRVFKSRPQSNLEQSYGADFANTLAGASPGKWLALSSRDGWRAIRLDNIIPAKPGVFEMLRGVVLQDWTDATLAEQRSAAVSALTKKYKIIIEQVQLEEAPK